MFKFVWLVKIVVWIFFIVLELFGLGIWLGKCLFGFKNCDFVVLVFKIWRICFVKKFLVLLFVLMIIWKFCKGFFFGEWIFWWIFFIKCFV